MHTGVILLIKADDRKHAEREAKEFLEPYGNDVVWDWYVIGGRWSGLLSEAKFDRDALKALNEEFGDKHGWYTGGAKTKETQAAAYNAMFAEKCPGWQDKIPAPLGWRDQYQKGGYPDDIMPLSECLLVVNEWQQDPIEAGGKEEAKAREWLNGTRAKDNWSMYGYCLKIAGAIYHQDFCFDCNVYNTEKFDYGIPEDVAGWWAVVIDMHT